MMKIFINSGHLMKRYLFVGVAMFWLSCDDDPEINYDETKTIDQVVLDSYVQVTTPVVGFQAGTDSYDYAINAINGTKAISAVKVYSVFTDAATGLQSNEVLLETLPVTKANRNQLTGNVTYEELKQGLTVNGGSLPASDVELKVGSGWKLRFEGVTSAGDINMPGNINIAVLSRFAGQYKVTKAEYYRIGELRNDVTGPWIGEKIFIGSVDEDTFSHNDWWGPFAWPGKSFHFDIDLATNKITVPLTPNGVYSDLRALSCAANGSDLSNAHCATSNILIPDDVTGKHKIILTYGYYVDAGAVGSREFYTELEKIVD